MSAQTESHRWHATRRGQHRNGLVETGYGRFIQGDHSININAAMSYDGPWDPMSGSPDTRRPPLPHHCRHSTEQTVIPELCTAIRERKSDSDRGFSPDASGFVSWWVPCRASLARTTDDGFTPAAAFNNVTVLRRLHSAPADFRFHHFARCRADRKLKLLRLRPGIPGLSPPHRRRGVPYREYSAARRAAPQ